MRCRAFRKSRPIRREPEKREEPLKEAFLERDLLDTFLRAALFKEDILLGNFARQPHSTSFYVQEGPW